MPVTLVLVKIEVYIVMRDDQHNRHLFLNIGRESVQNEKLLVYRLSTKASESVKPCDRNPSRQ